MNIIYETKRLIFTPASPIGEEWFFDPIVCRYNSHGIMTNKIREQLNPENNIHWDVRCKDFPEDQYSFCIGKVLLGNIDWINRKAEYSCIFGDKRSWGKGYGFESAKVMFDHGFNKIGLHKIWLGTVSENVGMMKIAEKLKMQYEGTLYQDVFLDGKFKDITRWGIDEYTWKSNI